MSITAEEFDEHEAEYDEGGLSGFYVLAIFLALLAAFVVIVFFAYERGKATATLSDADLPIVAADPRPVREEVPLATASNERKEVYDRIEGVTSTAVIADAKPGRDPLEGYASAPSALPEPGALTTPQATSATAAAAKRDTVPAAKPTPKPVTVAAVPAASTKPAAPKSAPAAAGTHVVQVGAFGSDDEAMRFYKTLTGKMGGFISDKSPDVQVAEVKGRTYHRLRLAPFTSKSAANEYCAGLKAKGQDCLVKGV